MHDPQFSISQIGNTAHEAFDRDGKPLSSHARQDKAIEACLQAGGGEVVTAQRLRIAVTLPMCPDPAPGDDPSAVEAALRDELASTREELAAAIQSLEAAKIGCGVGTIGGLQHLTSDGLDGSPHRKDTIYGLWIHGAPHADAERSGGCVMAETIRHKRGDTFLWLFVLPEGEYPDGFFNGWEVAAQIRTAKTRGKLIADLEPSWGDPAETTRILRLFAADTRLWPLGEHEMDVQFTRTDDETVRSTRTIVVEIVKDITLDGPPPPAADQSAIAALEAQIAVLQAEGVADRSTIAALEIQAAALRARVTQLENRPPGLPSQLDPADVQLWLAEIDERADAWLRQVATKPAAGGSKFAGQRALARLYVNPGDATVAAYLANNGQGGYIIESNGSVNRLDEFSRAGVALALIKYPGSFTSAQTNAIRDKWKQFLRNNDHSTENHALMNAVGSYLIAQIWPDESGWVKGVNWNTVTATSFQTSAEMMAVAKANLLSVAKSLYSKGYNEDLSTNYAPVHLYPWHCLYTGATDPEMKAVAKAAIDIHVVSMAARQVSGTTLAPFGRNGRWEASIEQGTNLGDLHYLYWGDVTNRTVRNDNNFDDFTTPAAISDWRPSAAILSIARAEVLPYVLTGSRPQFGFWGAYNAGNPNNSGTPDDRLSYVYRERLFGMGSAVYRYVPGSFYLDDAGFSIAYRSADRYNYIEAYHEYWRSNAVGRQFIGTNSPFVQTAQYKGAAVMLVNIPDADPWAGVGRADWAAQRDQFHNNLRKDLFLRYPNTVTSMVEEGGWIFLDEVAVQGSIYIAIYLGQPYTIGAPGAGISNVHSGVPTDWRMVTSNGAKNVAIFDVGTSDQFVSFAAFREAVLANNRTIDLANVSATYTSVNGATINTSWTAVDYTPASIGPTGRWVRPTVAITTETGDTITDPFPPARGGAAGNLMGRPVLSAPFVDTQSGTSMALTTPRGTHLTEWDGNVPVETIS
jgi:hypothetical protein